MNTNPRSRRFSPAKACWRAVLLLLGLAAQIPLAQAIDLRPGEARAPMPGMNFVQLRWQESLRDGFYANGQRQALDCRVSTSTRIVRLGRSFELGKR